MAKTIAELRQDIQDLGAKIKTDAANVAAHAGDAKYDIAALETEQKALADDHTRLNGLRASLSAQEMLEGAQVTAAAQAQIQGAAPKQTIFKSSGEFFKAVHNSRREIDPQLKELQKFQASASGQNVTTDADGGYLVPPEYADGLLKLAQTESVLYPKVQHVPVTSNRLIVNRIDETSRKDATELLTTGRGGGLLAYWAAEAEQYTKSQFKLNKDQTDLEKLIGLCYATDEMLEDVVAMGAYIAQGFRDEFSFKIDDAIYGADGSGKPQGIVDDGNTALVTIAKESGQANGSVLLANLLKIWNAMPAKNRAKAEWYINQDMEIMLMQLLMTTGTLSSTGASAVEDLTGAFGFPLYLPAGGITGSPNGTLLGRPVVPIEHAAAVGEAGDILFADLSQYRWIDKSGMNAQVSIHVRFEYDEQAFKFTYRCGGKPIWPNTIEAYKGSTVRSPYVALGARKAG